MAISTDNIKFINSDNINVFPCGGRDSKYDVTSKLTTEYNLVSIINRLVDLGSFVVSNRLPETGDFLFNIGGYLFSMSDLTFEKLINNKSEGSYIAAYIKPTSYKNNDMTYTLLSPLNTTSGGSIPSSYGGILDDNGNFTGVEFVLIPLADIPTSTDKSLGTDNYTFEFNPKSGDNAIDGVIKVTKTLLPLLLYNGGSWVIPPDSKIKFRTTTDGSYRSISIDDGELTSNNAPILPEQPGNIEVVSISLNKTNAALTIGDTLSLSTTISPSNATDTTITWISSNTSVATVLDGIVTAKSSGTATITVKTSNNKTATCYITVNNQDAEEDLELVITGGIVYSLKNEGTNNYYEVIGHSLALESESRIKSEINGVEVTSIRNSAFKQCTRLKRVTIPSSVINIGSEAFFDCPLLEQVDIEATVPPQLGAFAFLKTDLESIRVPASSITIYKEDANWGTYSNIISTID